MEAFDVFSIFMAGFAIGLIGAHHLNKHDVKLAYDRGVMDTIWEIQLHGMREHIARLLGNARDEKAGSTDGSNGPV